MFLYSYHKAPFTSPTLSPCGGNPGIASSSTTLWGVSIASLMYVTGFLRFLYVILTALKLICTFDNVEY